SWRAGFRRHAVHEQPRDVVDGGPVDQRLQQVGAHSQEGQQGDPEESLLVGPRQLEQNLPRAQVFRGLSSRHGLQQDCSRRSGCRGPTLLGSACGPDPDGVGIDCVSGVLARTYVGVPGRPASLPRPKLLDHRALSRDLRGRPPTGVLNRFGGGVPKYAANPGLTANFRRSLPEIGCLSQGLPHGKRCAWPCPPKTCKPPANCAQPGGRRLDVKLTACPHSSCGQESGSSVPEFNNLTAACPATTWRMPAATCPQEL